MIGIIGLDGLHAVPPPCTRNYMPSRPDLSFAGLDDYVYKTNVSETITSVPRNETTASKSSKDSFEQPKDVKPSASIIEEWESDSDDDYVIRPSFKQNKPSYAKINFVKSDEKTRKSVIEKNTYRQAENLRKSQTVLNNMGRVTGQREVRPVWNNAQRVNHQNKLTHPHPKRNFVPTAVATKSGLVPVNAAKQSSPRVAASISTARHQLKPIILVKKVYTARVNNVTAAGSKAVVNAVVGNGENVVKSSGCWIWRPTGKVIDHISKDSGSYMPKRFDYGNPQYALQDQGIFDSGCSRHMTGNKSYLTDYQDIDGGFVAFAGSPKGGKIIRKGKIRTGKLDFEDVYFVKELKFNLFSVSQMCDKKNSVLFTETECLVLSLDFKLLDESQILLKVPRQNNMYSFDLKNVVPSGEGKQQNASLRHAYELYQPSLTNVAYGLIWANISTKDETSEILKTFITGIENQINHKVKIIRCDNGTEFKNNDMNQFCGMKGIKREFSVARTPQQNGVAKRKNSSLIEAARTMLVDSLLPTTFWVEAVNTACYVQNKIPWENLIGRADEGFLGGYSIYGQGWQAGQEKASVLEYILLPLMLSNSPLSSNSQSIDNNDVDYVPGKGDDDLSQVLMYASEKINTGSPSINTASKNINTGSSNINNASPILNDSSMQSLENTRIFDDAYDDREVGAEADLNNLETTMNVNPIPTTRINKDHPKDQIIGDINSATQTRKMTKISEEHAVVVSEHSVINLTLLELGISISISIRAIPIESLCEDQDKWKCVLTRLIDDLLALDSKVRFDISDRRLELTATFSILTYSE
ncbi:ribonuclease H-like domain-containing protein [Tanacetum coccineum]